MGRHKLAHASRTPVLLLPRVSRVGGTNLELTYTLCIRIKDEQYDQFTQPLNASLINVMDKQVFISYNRKDKKR